MNTKSWLEIRPIPDDPETLRPFVTVEEWEKAASMHSSVRRNEWLAWRAVAREKLGEKITLTYDMNGAPVLGKGEGCLSVSHTKGWVAVVWSRERCAVDIEHVSRGVSRASEKFVSRDEKQLSDALNPLFQIAVWCAKEALYKYACSPGLDFLADIRIISSDITSGRMTGTVKGGAPIEIELQFRDGLIIATIF